jgi:predicted RNA-binding Zn ribbon-like protein
VVIMSELPPVELMNTLRAGRDGVYDTLTSWLGAMPVEVDGEVAEQFRSLRDALRVLAAELTEDHRAVATRSPADIAAATATVNEASALAPSWSELDGALVARTHSNATPQIAALARMAEAAVQLFGSSQRDELRACNAPGCVLYFMRDHPRREWCSPNCGNRARVARHYARHHTPESRG